jgi:hypothetical protein
MTLAELEHHETVVLLALLGVVARMDGQASSDEVELIARIGAEIDPASFEATAAEAARLEGAQLRAAVDGVTRPEAREVIYELLYDMAIKETIDEHEAELLDWLADAWGLPRRMGA